MAEDLPMEFMGRCRTLVEHRGRRSGTRIVYNDAELGIEWNPSAREPTVKVYDHRSGTLIGSWVGTQWPHCTTDATRLQELVTHLREIMVLDDLSRAVS